MALMIRFLHSVQFPAVLGNAGAIANAQRACEERRITEARIDAFLSSLSDLSVRQRPAAA